MYVLSVLEQLGASIIALLLRNTNVLAHKYSYKKIHFKNPLIHYTMMRVCFESPKTIRGFNNLSLAKKYPYFST